MPFGRLERRNLPAPMSDINMTPLIDVMLVLLVIFMITAPLMASSLKLDLPSSEGAQPGDAPRTVSVAIDENGQWFLGDEPVEAGVLRSRIAEIAAQNPDTEVQLRADKLAPYGQVAALIGEVQLGGLSRIALVAEPATAGAAAAN